MASTSTTASREAARASQKRTTAHLEDALRSLEETNTTSDATLVEMERQRRTLERTRAKVGEVEAHANYANWVLRGMSSWGGAILNAVTGPPKPARSTTGSPARPAASGTSPPPAASAAASASKDDPDAAILEGLERGLEALESKHRHIDAEAELHGELLDDIGERMGRADDKLRKASRTTRRVR